MHSSVAMMQPYLFPYLGYFQLINAVDVFVLGDDLQFIKSGWVNRNTVLFNQQARLISFPVKRDSFELAINQRTLSTTFSDEADRLVNLIRVSYAKAPCFDLAMPVVEALIRHPERNLALYIEHSIRQLCAYLRIDTPIFRASALKLGVPLDKQDRVIQIARRFAASTYVNPIGGLALYDHEYFASRGVALKFFRMHALDYPQFQAPFVANLSIIDVLMFNTVDDIQALLPRYSLHGAGPLQDKPLAARMGDGAFM